MRKAEAVFMTILSRLSLLGVRISDRKGVNYAPRIFAQESEAAAAKMGAETMAGAMGRLLRAGRIQVREEGQRTSGCTQSYKVSGSKIRLLNLRMRSGGKVEETWRKLVEETPAL
jgi:hypothetical protein